MSNADGTVADVLASTGLLQVGPGPGVEVRAIVDSGAVGIAKPDPGIFHLALEAAGTAKKDVAAEATAKAGDDGATFAKLVYGK